MIATTLLDRAKEAAKAEATIKAHKKWTTEKEDKIKVQAALEELTGERVSRDDIKFKEMASFWAAYIWRENKIKFMAQVWFAEDEARLFVKRGFFKRAVTGLADIYPAYRQLFWDTAGITLFLTLLAALLTIAAVLD